MNQTATETLLIPMMIMDNTEYFFGLKNDENLESTYALNVVYPCRVSGICCTSSGGDNPKLQLPNNPDFSLFSFIFRVIFFHASFPAVCINYPNIII